MTLHNVSSRLTPKDEEEAEVEEEVEDKMTIGQCDWFTFETNRDWRLLTSLLNLLTLRANGDNSIVCNSRKKWTFERARAYDLDQSIYIARYWRVAHPNPK